MKTKLIRKKPELSGGGINPFVSFLIVLLLIIIAVAIFAESTSRPSYCSSCHTMKNYVVSWQESSHAKYTCVKCHYLPGLNNEFKAKFIGANMLLKGMTTSAPGRPWDEVADSSCKRSGCHEESKLPGELDVKSVKFPHLQHASSLPRGKRLHCTSCHAEMTHYGKKKVLFETCYLCHLMPVKGETIASTYTAECKFCHAAPEGVIKKNGIEINHQDKITAGVECTKCHQLLTSGDGSAQIDKCGFCHANKEITKRITEIPFIHEAHLTLRNVECLRCHGRITHKMPSIDEPILAKCVVCHPNHHRESFDLYNTHKMSDGELYFSPEFIAHLECNACHIEKSGKETDEKGVMMVANAQSCIKCHHSRYGNFLEEWKLSIQNLISEVRTEIALVSGKVNASASSARIKDELNAKLNEASRNLLKVERGKGVHNIRYSDSLIRQSHDTLNEVLENLGSNQIRSEKIESYRFASTQECTGCHYGTAVYVGMFGTTSFSHIPHLAKGKVPCARCHEYVSRWEPHGKLKFTDSTGCKECHKAGSGCQSCHKGFDDKPISVFDKNFIHRPHVEGAQMVCLDCHLAESENVAHGKSTIEKASDCAQCHHGEKQTRLCADCHELQTAFEESKVPGIDESMKKISTHQFYCTKCHDLKQTQTRTVIAEKCVTCHNDSFVRFIDEWMRSARENLTQIGNLIKRARELDLTDEQKEELKGISDRYQYMLKAPKPGVHNPKLWKALQERDIKTLREWLGEA